jgi:dGTPase
LDHLDEEWSSTKGDGLEMSEENSVWKNLLDTKRRKPTNKETEEPWGKRRNELESDHDRILFSTPFRRLIHKTQVFPLEEEYDTIRRRLTHSMEVGNLCRSIGVAVVAEIPDQFPEEVHACRSIPAMLAALGLAHDLGNPPFGHQGEQAIREWFRNRQEEVLSGLSEQQRNDFLMFDGNAQTFRLVTRLQIIADEYGLNLTCATLAAMLKYTVPSDKTNADNAATKKFGYFASEQKIARDVQTEVIGEEGRRHPLTYLMEACDDIAYNVLDAEDAVKKGITSFADLLHYLGRGEDDPVIEAVLKNTMDHHEQFSSGLDDGSLTPLELTEISMQMFRVHAIHAMVTEVTDCFISEIGSLVKGTFQCSLIEKSGAKSLCSKLKCFSRTFIYSNRKIRELELKGYNVITNLMNTFWAAISKCPKKGDALDKPKSPYNAYVFSRISENYKRACNHALKRGDLPEQYIRLQLLTDMISGMTDSYAVALDKDLRAHRTNDSRLN